MTVAIMSVSVGVCSSAQWGCSLAVNLDGLSASEQDATPPDAAMAIDLGVGPDATAHQPLMDADGDRAADSAGHRPMPAGEEDGQAPIVDAGAPETMAVVAEAGAIDGEIEAPAADMAIGGQGPDAEDAARDQPDAAAIDSSAGDLSTEGDVGPGGPGAPDDASSGVAGDSNADAYPLACAPAPVASATLELANALPAQTACGYVPGEVPRSYAAVDSKVFDGSAACGACLIVETPAGRVEARVVDVGPAPSHANPTAVAVSRAAITVLAPDGSTLVTKGVDWHFSPCTLTTPGMTFKIQTGSNASYAGVLVENHRHRLAKVEYKIRATYYPLTRTTYNYWIAADGMGTGPFTFRLTDELGQTVEQTGVPLAPGSVFRGQAQFPACAP